MPVFLRFTKELEMTSTFKQVKTGYVKQGIDIGQLFSFHEIMHIAAVR